MSDYILFLGPLQLVPIVTRPPSFQFPIPVATIQSSSTAAHQQLPVSPVLPKYYPVSYKSVSLQTLDVNRNVFSRTDRIGDVSGSSEVLKQVPAENITTDVCC